MSLLLWLEPLIQLDEQAMLFFNGLHTDWLDPVAWFFSHKLTWVPFYLFLAYMLYKQYGWKQTLLLLLFIGLAITLADRISSGWMKPGFARLRPCHQEHLASLLYIPFKCGGKYGFVSSHAANVFSLATFLGFYFKRSWAFWLFAWAVLVSYSRIYLGVHFPGDLVGGALLGLLVGWFCYLLSRIAIQRILQKPV